MPAIGLTPGRRRPVRTITFPSTASRRIRFGEPTSPRPSGVIVAAFRPKPAFAHRLGRLAARRRWRSHAALQRQIESLELDSSPSRSAVEQTERLVEQLLPRLIPLEDDDRDRARHAAHHSHRPRGSCVQAACLPASQDNRPRMSVTGNASVSGAPGEGAPESYGASAPAGGTADEPTLRGALRPPGPVQFEIRPDQRARHRARRDLGRARHPDHPDAGHGAEQRGAAVQAGRGRSTCGPAEFIDSAGLQILLGTQRRLRRGLPAADGRL